MSLNSRFNVKIRCDIGRSLSVVGMCALIGTSTYYNVQVITVTGAGLVCWSEVPGVKGQGGHPGSTRELYVNLITT
jgi:hypothetical protein